MRMLSLLLALILSLPGCTVSFNDGAASEEVNLGTEEQQREVLAAAKRVADYLDRGQTQEVWALTGPILRAQASERVFSSTVGGLRKPLGAAGHRDVKGFNFPTELDGHKGTFGLVAAETDFALAQNVEEKFVFQRVGSEWRLIGYFVSKKLTLGARHTPNHSFKPTPLRGAA
jgi:hypothetical protein